MAPRSASSERRHLQRVRDPVVRLPYLTDVGIGEGGVEKQGDAMAARPAFRRVGIAACIDFPPTPCDSAVSLPGAALYVRSILTRAPAGHAGETYTTTRRFAAPLLK